MDLKYSPWKPLIDGHNHKHIVYCPYCENPIAEMMTRYVTDRMGETERQYRVQCPICKHAGKTYVHESIAKKSWEVRENDPPKQPVYKRGRWIT